MMLTQSLEWKFGSNIVIVYSDIIYNRCCLFWQLLNIEHVVLSLCLKLPMIPSYYVWHFLRELECVCLWDIMFTSGTRCPVGRVNYGVQFLSPLPLSAEKGGVGKVFCFYIKRLTNVLKCKVYSIHVSF